MINLGNVVGYLKSVTAPTKTNIIWGKILNIAYPDIVVLYYYDAHTTSWERFDAAQGFFLPPVKELLRNAPPGSPTMGDRYIVGSTPSGAWVGHGYQHATYTGTAWDFIVPKIGMRCGDITTPSNQYVYTAANTWTTYDGNNILADLDFSSSAEVADGDTVKEAIEKLQGQITNSILTGDFIPLQGTGAGNEVYGNIEVVDNVTIFNGSYGIAWTSTEVALYGGATSDKVIGLTNENFVLGKNAMPANKGSYNYFMGSFTSLTFNNSTSSPLHNLFFGLSDACIFNSSQHNFVFGNNTALTLNASIGNFMFSYYSNTNDLSSSISNFLVGAFETNTIVGNYNHFHGTIGTSNINGNCNVIFGTASAQTIDGGNNFLSGLGVSDTLNSSSSYNFKYGTSSSLSLAGGAGSSFNFLFGTVEGSTFSNSNHNALFGDISVIFTGSVHNFVSGIHTASSMQGDYNFLLGNTTCALDFTGDYNFIFQNNAYKQITGSRNFILFSQEITVTGSDNFIIDVPVTLGTVSGSHNFVWGSTAMLIKGARNFVASTASSDDPLHLNTASRETVILGSVTMTASKSITGLRNTFIGTNLVGLDIATDDNLFFGRGGSHNVNAHSGNTFINVFGTIADRDNSLFVPLQIAMQYDVDKFATITSGAITTSQVYTLPLTGGTLAKISDFEIAPTWRKITKTYADFSAANMNSNFTISALAAGENIHACRIKHGVAFSGGSVGTCVLSVGIVTDVSKYGGPYDLQAAVAHDTIELSNSLFTESQVNAVNIIANLQTTGGNLDTLAAGSVDIWILVSKTV